MEANSLIALSLMLAVATPMTAQAQGQPVSSQNTAAPLLTLEDAVSLALGNNRLVKNSLLEAQKFDARVSTVRSRRLPHFQFSVLGGELLNSVDFTFPRGAFGTYPNTGAIPEKDTKIRTPRRFSTYITGGLDQPLTQQYKIDLGIRVTEAGRDIAREDVRAERQKIAAEVRNAYFELVATQAGLEAARQAVGALQEAQRLTVRYRAEETVLSADALEIDARLEKSRYELSVTENGLSTQSEDLNHLLGRDLDTPFRVDPIPEQDLTGMTLDDARQRAAQNRPELRQAHLKEKQAEYDRRLAQAEYIPDVSAYVGYLGVHNVEVVPTDVGVAGFLLTWEPFDWGRRHNTVVEKTKTLEQARNGAREAEAQVAVEVGLKYRKWQDATLLLKASRTGHEAAAEQFRVISNKYKEKAALVKDLLQAQVRSAETESQYQQALSSYGSAVSDVHRAMGEE